MNFLKFRIEVDEINIKINKVKSIKNKSIFTTIKQVQGFLEFVNYNKKFIKNFFRLTLSLINLSKKERS